MVGFWTIFGIWIGALCTLAIWSFLYKDNPFYKFAEQVFVGVSAAYGFIYTIYNNLIPNLFIKLFPGVFGWLDPSADSEVLTEVDELATEVLAVAEATPDGFAENWVLLIPGILGLMMLARLFPRYDWLSKFPLSLMIGTSAGLAILMTLKSNVILQTIATMMNPLKANDPTLMIGQFLIIIGTITGLVYFYFSKKHVGFTGGLARVGIVFLMISFGASFGYTAMARISLLIGRLQFLLGDWLHLLK